MWRAKLVGDPAAEALLTSLVLHPKAPLVIRRHEEWLTECKYNHELVRCHA